MFFRAYNLTPTPPKSKSYTTPKNSVQNSKSKIRRKKNPKCPDSQCNSNYIGQTKCRLLKRVIQHNKQDKNSNLLIHSNDKSPSTMAGWLWNHREGIQVELQTPNQWSASHKRKSSRFEHSKRRLSIESVQLIRDVRLISLHLQCRVFNVHSTFLMMPYGCMAKYWLILINIDK